MEQLKLKKYKKGEKLAGIYVGGPTSFAGEDLYIASAYGIYADVFDKGRYYQVPNIMSIKPGSGRLLDFLVTLKRGLDKPVYFCTITNDGMYKYLYKADIGIVKYEDKKPHFYKLELMVTLGMKEIKNKS